MSDIRDFGATGDGQTDDSRAIFHALKDGDGTLQFPPGDYLITRTIPVALDTTGRFSLSGTGGAAKIIMAGAGPAFHLVGTHAATADPKGFQPEVWKGQRMPTVTNIEIEGRHAEASGFWLEGTMQSTFEGVLLRELLDGIRVAKRARNVLVSHCHIYNNRRYGIWFDQLNLHQAIIASSHISYCKRAGIRISGSEIRNLQITGNDIEYNYEEGVDDCADVYIDCSDGKASVREGTIASNTIQAKYSTGGANVRMVGWNPEVNHKAGLFTITGNMIGSQETNIHLKACRGVVVSGNVVYSGHRRNLTIEGSRNIVCGNNSFDHNPDYDKKELCTGVTLIDSNDITFNGSLIHDCQAGQHTVKDAPPLVREGLLEVIRCRRVNISGCEILDGTPHGIYVEDGNHVSITGCTVLDSRSEKKTRSAIRFKGQGRMNLVATNTLGKGTHVAIESDATMGVLTEANQIDPEA
jgi:hypothetical protein